MASARLNYKMPDSKLLSRLQVHKGQANDHWSFRGDSQRRHGHAYFQYPAMMVPQMVGALLDAISLEERRAVVYDPFAGSGTALTESMMRGLDFAGQDLNPLAILLCQAKSIPFFDSALSQKLGDCLRRIRHDRQSNLACDFSGLSKWFTSDAAIQLSKIRRAIQAESSIWVRRFLWIAIAETVRLCSNSRTSTFKLHIRPSSEIQNRRISPIPVFERIAKRNLEQLRMQKKELDRAGFLNRGRYIGNVDIRIADTSSAVSVFGTEPVFDVLITSPPYGDNKSTVPYGQHSYLPLQWIDLEDIDESLDQSCLVTTHEIDSRSLGGSLRDLARVEDVLRAKSDSLNAILDRLSTEPRDRSGRVLAFFRDLDACLGPIVQLMKPKSVLVWILGNRCVGGQQVPLDSILLECLESRGIRHVTTLERTIPSKRMAVRNNIATTMRSESILVTRKD